MKNSNNDSYKEKIRAELLEEKVQYKSYLMDIFKGSLAGMYLAGRAQAPMSVVLTFLYVDKILWLIGITLWITCFILGIFFILKDNFNSFKYSSNEKRFFSFLEYQLHVPYDYEEKPKPIIPFKKLLLYMLYTELAISSFFIIDYLFGL